MGNFFGSQTEKDASAKDHVLNGSEDASEIQDGLFLGNSAASESHAWQTANGITHIVSVIPHRLPPAPSNIKRLQVRIRDSQQDLIAIHFDTAIEFIGAALNSDGRVLVHCWRGISRSATIMIAYIMRSRRLQYKAALAFVKAQRPCIDPNPGFQTQLVSAVVRYPRLLALMSRALDRP